MTPCTNFTVRVRIRDVTDLYAWQFKMTFDPTLMQCLSVTEGEFLRNVGPTMFPGAVIDNIAGSILAACTLLVPPGASGGCVLAYVTFHCKAAGESTLNMDYPDTFLLDSSGNPIPRSVEPGVVVQQEVIYRYKVKFECRWEIEVVGPCDPTVPSQRIPVETLITTHINVYNPDHRVPVKGFKYFVQCLSEPEPIPPILIGGHTLKNHTFVIPPNKGFEIDCDDVSNWPVDTSQPPLPPWPCDLKGFVVIESLGYPLEVVAVYNKKSADIVNKITFKVWPICWGYIDTLIGRIKLYEPYELAFVIPFEPENITLPELVKRELGFVIPFEPEDIDVEIVETKVYFDFLECVAKEIIVFKLKATETLWTKYLDQLWPPSERPPGFVWPDWIWPCRTLEILWKPPINWTTDDLGAHATPVPFEPDIDDLLESSLRDGGVPIGLAEQIVAALWIEIIDVDVGEGVGASIDVEYIEPQIITGPIP